MARSLPLVAVLLLTACGSDPVETCEDFADAFATVAEDCGFDYGEYHQAILDLAVDGTCDQVVDVRDPKSFEKECLTWVEELPCGAIDDPDLEINAACKDQLRL